MSTREIKNKAKEILKEGGCKKLYIAVVAYTLITLVVTLCEKLKLPSVVILIVSIILLILQRSFSYGLTKMFIRKKNGEEVGILDFLSDGCHEFRRAWSITFSVLPKFLLPIICYVVGCILPLMTYMYKEVDMTSGIMESGMPYTMFGGGLALASVVLFIVGSILMIPLAYKYRYVDNEAIENPDLTSREVVRKTGEIMQGNKFDSFCIDLSFFLKAFLFGLLIGLISVIIPVLGSILEVLLIAVIQTELLMAHVVFYEDKSPISAIMTEEVPIAF